MYSMISVCLLTVFVFGPSLAFSDIEDPLRKVKNVHQRSQVEQTQRVSTASVIVADYELIKKDFPQLRNKTHSEIDEFLINSVAYIAKPQARQTEVNTQISLGQEMRLAYRPPDYRRALVFEVDGGLIDGKGFGSLNPAQKDHQNGLTTLGEVIREYLYEKLVQKIFNHSGYGRRTVGSYAVIDWGFRVIHPDGSSSPAGAILRQAHRRSPLFADMLSHESTRTIELELRKYGITSAGSHRDSHTEKLNIQGTIQGAVVDFGAFLAVEKFSRRANPFYDKKIELLSPHDSDFTQPDPELRVPFEIWGTTQSRVEDPKQDNPWIWSHELAEALASGRAQRKDVDQHLRNLLDPVDAKLSQVQFSKKIKSCYGQFSSGASP